VRAICRPFLGLLSLALFAVSLTLPTAVASAAGCGAYGNCPPAVQPTLIPAPVGVVASQVVVQNQPIFINVPPSSSTGGSTVQITAPASVLPPGAVVSLSSIPSTFIALYRVNGHLVVLTQDQVRRIRAHVSSAAALPVRFANIASFYVGAYQGTTEVTKFNGVLTVTVKNPNIVSSNIVYQTYGKTWKLDKKAVVAPGSVTVSLNTDRAFDVINLLGADVTLRYDANGGRGHVASLKVPSGTQVTLPSGSGLTRKGFQFAGWSTTGQLPALTNPFLATASTVLKAIWQRAVTNVLTYNDNGGTGVVPPVRILGNADLILNSGSTLQRSGYVFAGWSTTGLYPALTSPYYLTSSVTLKAIWNKATTVYLFYRVTAPATGKVSPVQVHGSGIIRLNDGHGLANPGYLFGGWSLSGRLPSLTSPLDLTSTTTVQAIWVKPTSFTLRYDLNGGRGIVRSVHARVNALVDLDAGLSLHRRGYSFVGWSTSGQAPVLAGTYYLTGNVTLKAVWAKIHYIHVRYNLNGASGMIQPITLPGSGVIQLPSGVDLHRSGYQFLGWSRNGHLPALTSPLDVTSALTLKAIWKHVRNVPVKKPVTTTTVKPVTTTTVKKTTKPHVTHLFQIKFDLNGADGVVEPTSLMTPTVIQLPVPNGPFLHRFGYKFLGWSANGQLPALSTTYDATGPITLKAIWMATTP